MKVLTNSKKYTELGEVTWLRDYDEALRKSREVNKPVLMLFQEIPGCSTCVNYGQNVLSHPLMVEFIENEFVPLAIFNNKPGKDAQILNIYNEPPWNNPVTHFIDASGKDIIPKLSNDFSSLGLYNKMVYVLTVLEKAIPKYVQMLGDDLKIKQRVFKQTIYETPCFWSGETSMALHPAVKYTESGWINGLEVVKVFYNEAKISLKKLDAFAAKEGFFIIDNHQDFKTDKQPQYYVSKSPFKYLPLSKAQKAMINAAIPYENNPESFLSPKQLSVLEKRTKGIGVSGKSKNYIQDIELSWSA